MDNFKIIDAHVHLWEHVDTVVEGKTIRSLKNGRSIFLDQEVQMLPPFMIDGVNSAEVLLSNMNYAQVSAAVVTQEFIDGNQNEYLAKVKATYPDRFFVNGFVDFRLPGYLEKAQEVIAQGFKGIAVPAHRLPMGDDRVWLNSPEMMAVFKLMEKSGVILSITPLEGTTQVDELKEVIQECPDLKIAIGHFAMVTQPGWMEQIKLAHAKNVFVESGGITWLFNSEFYPFDGAVRAIREAADEVGIEKLMWGSDYPRTITAITYKMSYDFVSKSSLLTHDEKAAFLGENAQKFYGFGALDFPLPYIKNMSE